MPTLHDPLHMSMFQVGIARRNFASRLSKAVKILVGREELYGLEWGDPENVPPLKYFRSKFMDPYLDSSNHVVEIGPGGGRWTRYMLDVERLYLVDMHQEILDTHRARFHSDNLTHICNNGTDFPGIPDASVDFLFSFGVFVHLDLDIIEEYLKSMKRLLKPESNVVLHYSDITKPMGERIVEFSRNQPELMRDLVRDMGYSIIEEDTKTLWHSSVVRFGL